MGGIELKKAAPGLWIALVVLGVRPAFSAPAKSDQFATEPLANLFRFSPDDALATPIIRPGAKPPPIGEQSLSLAAKAAVKLRQLKKQLDALAKEPNKCSDAGRQQLAALHSDLQNLDDRDGGAPGELGQAYLAMHKYRYDKEQGACPDKQKTCTTSYLTVWKAVYSLLAEADTLRQRVAGLKVACEM